MVRGLSKKVEEEERVNSGDADGYVIKTKRQRRRGIRRRGRLLDQVALADWGRLKTRLLEARGFSNCPAKG